MSFNNSFIKLIYKLKSTESKLNFLESFGEINSTFDVGVYEAKELEEHVINEYLKSSARLKLNISQNNVIDKTLHIISIPFVTGGHTRLCERLASMEENRPNLLITQASNSSSDAIKRISSYFDSTHCVNSNTMEGKVEEYIQVIRKYSHIVLHIHQHDIALVTAIGVIKKHSHLQVIFVNHADHCFSFGDSVIDVKLQVSSRGYFVDEYRPNKQYISSFIGIPLDEVNSKPTFNDKPTNFVMAGSSWKMKPNKYASSPLIVDYILSKDKAYKFIVIGANLLTDFWWWKVLIKHRKRLKIYKNLPYEEYLSLVNNVDACVDSSPVTGGTAFVEMFLQGLKPMGLNSAICGYTPLDVVKSNDIYTLLSKDIPEDLFDKIKFIHGYDNVKKRYLSAFSGQYTELPDILLRSNHDIKFFGSDKKIKCSGGFLRKIRFIKGKEKVKFLMLIVKYFSFTSLMKVLFLASLKKPTNIFKWIKSS